MRVLIVSPFMPYPPTWGFAIRVFQFVRLLSRHHSVELATYGDPADSKAIAELGALGVPAHVVPRATGTFAKRLEQVSSVLSTRSYQWRAMHSPKMEQTLQRVTRREPFDIIQIESSQLAAFEYD